MAEASTVARPYAQAVFQVAKAQGKFKEWSDALAHLAGIVADERVQKLIGNTSVKKERIATLFIDVAGAKLNTEGKNLVKVLTENRRLTALPEIAAQFEELRAQAESTIDAEVVSALAVDAGQQQRISAALQKRLGRKVNLVCKIDPSLLGGAVVRAGDLVIDGSALGRLQKLSVRLS